MKPSLAQASPMRNKKKCNGKQVALALVALLLSSEYQVEGYCSTQTQPKSSFRKTTVLFAGTNGEEKDEDLKSIQPIIRENDRTRNNRFASPLLEFGYPPAVEEYKQGKTAEKPLLLYIPGFDGTYLSAFFQYPELQSLFEVRCLVSAMDDRSTFDELKQKILDFIDKETAPAIAEADPKAKKETVISSSKQSRSRVGEGILANIWNKGGRTNKDNSGKPKTKPPPKNSRRPVYLAGESFGGILALEVALTLENDNPNNINLQGLTLVNAATCYDRSRLAAEGPAVAQQNPFLYVLGILQLLPMFLDDISAKQFLAIVSSQALPSLIDNPMREAYMGRLALALPFVLKFMPQPTFQWRLNEWLQVGCKRIEERLSADDNLLKNLPTLIVAGEKDLTLPSIAEAERLAQMLPNSRVHVVPQVGHANTAGTCLDLAAEMRGWFSELQTEEARTAMKPVAAQNQGVLFGMEPRYDNASIGLSPLLYWSKENYQKVDGYSPQ